MTYPWLWQLTRPWQVFAGPFSGSRLQRRRKEGTSARLWKTAPKQRRTPPAGESPSRIVWLLTWYFQIPYRGVWDLGVVHLKYIWQFILTLLHLKESIEITWLSGAVVVKRLICSYSVRFQVTRTSRPWSLFVGQGSWDQVGVLLISFSPTPPTLYYQPSIDLPWSQHCQSPFIGGVPSLYVCIR